MLHGILEVDGKGIAVIIGYSNNFAECEFNVIALAKLEEELVSKST